MGGLCLIVIETHLVYFGIQWHSMIALIFMASQALLKEDEKCVCFLTPKKR
jgi:hypothetical protein